MTFIENHLDTIITIITTIVGFIITFRLTKKSFKDEVIKNKIAIGADAMKEIPFDLCQMMNRMTGKGTSKPFSAEEYAELLSKILSYGSKDAVSIAVHMQRLAFKGIDGDKRWEILGTYALLITQIKYDLTSEIISPESWFNMKITDYKTIRSEVIKYINQLVESLNLNKEFRIEA